MTCDTWDSVLEYFTSAAVRLRSWRVKKSQRQSRSRLSVYHTATLRNPPTRPINISAGDQLWLLCNVNCIFLSVYLWYTTLQGCKVLLLRILNLCGVFEKDLPTINLHLDKLDFLDHISPSHCNLQHTSDRAPRFKRSAAFSQITLHSTIAKFSPSLICLSECCHVDVVIPSLPILVFLLFNLLSGSRPLPHPPSPTPLSLHISAALQLWADSVAPPLSNSLWH